MSTSLDRVMYFHASASPIGGYLTHPFHTTLENTASVALGQAGGHAKGRHDNYKLHHFISSGAAHSHVAGAALTPDGNWTTLVTSVVEDLNVLEVVTADRLVARLSIEHRRVGSPYPKVSFVGTQFVNLRINGQPVEPVLNLGLLSGTRYQRIAGDDPAQEDECVEREDAPQIIEFPDMPWPDVRAFVQRAEAESRAIVDSKYAPQQLKDRYSWVLDNKLREEKEFVLCSLVETVKGTDPCNTFGHIVRVPDFGNIFLGELIVEPAAFHLTMLRVELGCPVEGTVSFADGYGNGRGMP